MIDIEYAKIIRKLIILLLEEERYYTIKEKKEIVKTINKLIKKLEKGTK